MQIAVLVNPAAGTGRRSRTARAAVDRMTALGLRTVIIGGDGAARAAARLRDVAARPDIDAIAVIGGDGTARLALDTARSLGKPLSLIPAGTGNDLARTLGLDPRDPRAAVEAIAAGATRSLDLVRVRDAAGVETLYAGILACGFDARVNARANAMTRPRGGARYTIALLRELLRLRTEDLGVEWDAADGTTHRVEKPLLMATVGNGRTYGGGIPVCPTADPSDGLLDVVLVRPAGRARLLRLLPRLYRGTHGGVAEVGMHRARRVRLVGSGVPAFADGDPVGILPLEIEVLPRAVRMFVAQAAPTRTT